MQSNDERVTRSGVLARPMKERATICLPVHWSELVAEATLLASALDDFAESIMRPMSERSIAEASRLATRLRFLAQQFSLGSARVCSAGIEDLMTLRAEATYLMAPPRRLRYA